MRVRIQHNGQQVGGIHTCIIDADTGELVEYVQRVELDIKANHEPVLARITVALPVVDIVTDAEIRRICPTCGGDIEEEKDATPFLGRD